MTDLSQQIFTALESTIDSGLFVPMKELESKLGVRERALQSEKGNPGPLDNAIEEIYEEKRLFLIVQNGKGGGVKLTKNVEEVSHAKNRLLEHAYGEIKKAEIWDAQIKGFRDPQLRLIV